MRFQVVAGGAVIVVSVASAAAAMIMEGRWLEGFTSHDLLHSEATLPVSARDTSADAPRDTASEVGPAQASGPEAAVQPTPQSPPSENHSVVEHAFACANPNAMGVSRIVQIDTTGGPGFGSLHFKSFDFLHDHEVVLTFDDGPWPTSPAVLDALAAQCLRATFLLIGKHATYHPNILKQVVAAGHTIGTHTWSHADLQTTLKKKGLDAAEQEVEKGVSAIHLLADAPVAPFIRLPYLRHPPELLKYLGERNIAVLSCDIDSNDYRIKNPEELTRTLIAQVNKAGKGIILMHDFQKVTSIALPHILAELQKNGFKVVHMVPKKMLDTLPQYDEEVSKENKFPTEADRHKLDNVVKTIGGH